MATLAEQSIEQSIVEDAAERARNGGSHTLAQHSLDEEARAILDRRAAAKRNVPPPPEPTTVEKGGVPRW